MQEWVRYCHQIVSRGVKVFEYANNHYAGFGPATVAQFIELWNGE
ncbi:MAG: hypothetical protein WBQ34_07225 [Candidatus Acidiferrales bacterium]